MQTGEIELSGLLRQGATLCWRDGALLTAALVINNCWHSPLSTPPPDNSIPATIETPRGLLVACLRRTERQKYAINHVAAARYRERQSVARAKSDRVGAELPANIVRTGQAAHRPVPADSEMVQAIAVLARAQQDAGWNRQHIANQLRSLLGSVGALGASVYQRGR